MGKKAYSYKVTLTTSENRPGAGFSGMIVYTLQSKWHT